MWYIERMMGTKRGKYLGFLWEVLGVASGTGWRMWYTKWMMCTNRKGPYYLL